MEKNDATEEEMVEITFGNIRPATEEEKEKFAALIKELKESGDTDDILIPKFFDEGRVEMVKLEDIVIQDEDPTQ